MSLRNGTERPSGSILVFHDITEIQRLETVRSDFVANVSHELRTPLTAIRGYVETLLHNPPPDPADANQFLTIIDRHTERLSRLTEDLLVLSDLESGARKMTLKAGRSKSTGSAGARSFLGPGSEEESNAISIQLPPDYPRFLVTTIGCNNCLLTWSIMPSNIPRQGDRSRSLPAQTHFGAQADAAVEIAVVDTGAGIAEKDLPRLTERFYRVDKARSRELGGTGLGLAIVKHIVLAHGGELKIESVINKGTTVRVFLPGVAAEKTPDATLFLCTGNSCRSQMAEGFARQLVRDGQRVYSAGTAPKEIHLMAIQVMKEVGIDISGQHSKGVESIPLNQIQRIVTLCGEAEENCPDPILKQWNISIGPSLTPRLHEGTKSAFCKF